MQLKKYTPAQQAIPQTVSKRPLFAALCGGIVAIVIVIGGLILWYQNNLLPVQLDKEKAHTVRFTVQSGETPEDIAVNLQKHKLIRNKDAFLWHAAQEKVQHKLQAGTYALKDTLSADQILKHLVEGKTDLFNITITPGRTLKELKQDLKEYGYTNDEIDQAFTARYNSPLFDGRPSGTSLEGYLYPETFQVQSRDSLKAVLERDFALFYEQLSSKGLLAAFKARGLTTYQALTLASIVQRESSNVSDQKQIAQVFYKRLATGMKLESDVTFIYAAEQLGVEPSVGLDSPYNTRKNGGLPPGPIGNMNLSALEAVAYPAEGDYVYFVAGDDGNTYFSRTVEEHEANVAAHCKKLCEMY